jgi:hypothetical protein
MGGKYMDDDLMSLRGSASSSNKEDDLLGGFGDSPGKSEPSGWTDAGGSPDLDFGSLTKPTSRDWSLNPGSSCRRSKEDGSQSDQKGTFS